MNGKNPRPAKIYFDGGCRPNPGKMESAVVIRGFTDIRPDLGAGDNERAEWLALLHALEIAAARGERDIVLIGDSLSVIGQAGGAQRCRLPDMLDRYAQLARGFERVRLRHVGRAQNLAGIVLDKVRFGP